MDIRGVPVYIDQLLAFNTAYLIDIDVPNRPRPFIITDRLETVRDAIRQWEELIDRRFLKSCGIWI